MIIYPAFPAQFAEFCGHSTALDTEIIRQLLAVIRNRKNSAFILFGLHQQISHQLFLGGPFGSQFNLLIQHNVFGGNNMQKVGDNPIMKFTGIAAGGDDTAAVQQKNLTVGNCGCSDRQFFYAGAGKSFAKEL